MLVALSFCALVLGFCLWVTITGRDAWPFSAYPMFSEYRAPAITAFHRLRFVRDGGAEDLTQTDSGLADDFDRAFAALWRSTSSEGRGPQCTVLLRSYWRAASVLRPSLREARRLEVILRSAVLTEEQPISVVEQSIFAIDTAELRSEG